jgi:hypothetical protein
MEETMNEQQNPDGSWSKAEPIKASWEKRRQKKQKSGFYLQLRQLSAALLFIVVNSLHKHHDDRMLTIFFVLSYTVFLLTTVDNIKILKKLYDEVIENNEEGK